MKGQIVTTGIVLNRIDFQEADRIISLMTPDQGKIRLIAKGVRKLASKLAGGIELFSVSEITFIRGKSDLGTLVSSRLKVHFGKIVQDIDRTMLGYEFLKRTNKVTEDAADTEYFDLLRTTLSALNDLDLPLIIIEFWFTMQLLHISGHAPNLRTNSAGEPLKNDVSYSFDYDIMAFSPHSDGLFLANHIKLLSLGIRASQPAILTKVQGASELLPALLVLAKTILSASVRI